MIHYKSLKVMEPGLYYNDSGYAFEIIRHYNDYEVRCGGFHFNISHLPTYYDDNELNDIFEKFIKQLFNSKKEKRDEE